MTATQWKTLGRIDFPPLRKARMQAHYAPQWLARGGPRFRSRPPDDGHTNLGWDDGFDGFSTHRLRRRPAGLRNSQI